MKNRPPPQRLERWRELQQSQYSESHDKESTSNNVSDQPPPTTTTSSTTAFSTTTSSVPDVNATQRRPYPVKPSTPKAATAFSLFSDPDAFNLTTIYDRTHYLSSSLQGKIWWDVNGDGKRGEYGNATLNDMEYDYGVPNVGNIFLVTCDDEGDAEKKGSTTSKPFNGRDATPLRQSLNGEAGLYDIELSTVSSGRYYFVYQAPRGWRLSGNTLPLGRKELDVEGYYECLPQGGNGGAYVQLARDQGDLDYGGYCARSIGCVEIGSQAELEAKYTNLELLAETDYFQDVIQGDTMGQMGDEGGKMVAFPTPEVMDVGMSQEAWDLPAKQYADAVVTLTFPLPQVAQNGRGLSAESPLETLFTDVFAGAETFGTSMNRQAMGEVLNSYLKDNIEALSSSDSSKNESASFTFSGVDLFGAKIERKKLNPRKLGRYLRRAQDNGDEAIDITYSFTARGTYRPPPHEQLGYFVQDSINVDPTNLARVLRQDPALPFEDLESVDSSHLTVGPAPKVCSGCVGIQAISTADVKSKLDAWATIPVILVSLLIGALVFLFFGRRLWKRHGKVGSGTKREMRTMDFAVSDLDLTKEKDSLAMVSLVEETTEEGDCSRASSEKNKKRKKGAKKTALNDRSMRTDASDTSELSSIPRVEEVDSSSSSSSEDESEEARRRRRRRERRSKRASRRSIRSDPPSLEELRREKKKKKRSSRSKGRSRSKD